MIDFSQFNNLISVITYFSDEKRCKETIAKTRWTDGDVVCPYCGQSLEKPTPMVWKAFGGISSV